MEYLPERAHACNRPEPVSGSLPIVAAEFELNKRDCVRASIDEFNGRMIVNLRKWFRADDGEMRPTAKGLAVALSHLPALAELVNAALDRARMDGLLPPDGGRI